nr:2-phosphosulfolactate phosphatase [uncultured Sphingomonas sp.]
MAALLPSGISPMMPRIACEWGLSGIEAWKASADLFVIVDVLSFSTAVSVAVGNGAIVFPFPYGDAPAAAAEAARHGAVAASPRSAGGGQLSLSPASLKHIAPGGRLLLPSPNGSRLSLATGDAPTLCGCLRNARAVGAAASRLAGDGTIVVIAAGERWPDQTLRPAIEDWLGAGAIIDALGGTRNAEADLAAEAYRAAKPRLAQILRDSRSGRELSGWGYAADIEVALEVDAADVVPMMREGAYQAL